MPYHNPNSRSRRNVLHIVGVLVVLAVIAGVANFLHATTSEAAGNVKPQIETMQGHPADRAGQHHVRAEPG